MTRRRKKEPWILSISLAGFRATIIIFTLVIKIISGFVYIIATYKPIPLIKSKNRKKNKWH